MHPGDEVVDVARLDHDPPVAELVAHVTHRRASWPARTGPACRRPGAVPGPGASWCGARGRRVRRGAARARPASRRRAGPAGGLKHTPAWPVGTRPAVTCRVTAADGKGEQGVEVGPDRLGPPQEGVEQAHQRDVAVASPTAHGRHPGWFISASSLASWSRRFCSGGWVENSDDRLVPVGQGRGEVEGVEVLGRAQVPGRDPRHLAGHLDQGRGEQRRSPDEDGPRAVGGQLAVARQRHREQEADGVDEGGDHEHGELDQGGLSGPVRLLPPPPKPPNIPA